MMRKKTFIIIATILAIVVIFTTYFFWRVVSFETFISSISKYIEDHNGILNLCSFIVVLFGAIYTVMQFTDKFRPVLTINDIVIRKKPEKVEKSEEAKKAEEPGKDEKPKEDEKPLDVNRFTRYCGNHDFYKYNAGQGTNFQLELLTPEQKEIVNSYAKNAKSKKCFTITYDSIFDHPASFILNFLSDGERANVDACVNEIHLQSSGAEISSVEFKKMIIYYNNCNAFSFKKPVTIYGENAVANLKFMLDPETNYKVATAYLTELTNNLTNSFCNFDYLNILLAGGDIKEFLNKPLFAHSMEYRKVIMHARIKTIYGKTFSSRIVIQQVGKVMQISTNNTKWVPWI